MNAIDKRVSIRTWEAREVEPEKIREILRAAMQAPSAGNQRPWEFYIVRDREIIRKLSEISKYSGCMADAPVAIVNVCDTEGRRFPEVAPVDMAICTEHEWLQIAELDLGGVWIGVAPFEDRIEKVGTILDLPTGQWAFSIMAFGYPQQRKEAEDRFDEGRIHEL